MNLSTRGRFLRCSEACTQEPSPCAPSPRGTVGTGPAGACIPGRTGLPPAIGRRFPEAEGPALHQSSEARTLQQRVSTRMGTVPRGGQVYLLAIGCRFPEAEGPALHQSSEARTLQRRFGTGPLRGTVPLLSGVKSFRLMLRTSLQNLTPQTQQVGVTVRG